VSGFAARTLSLTLTLALFALSSCSDHDGPGPAETLRQPTLYGADDRTQYFQASDVRARVLVAKSSVALIPDEYLDSSGQLAAGAPTWGARDSICSGEAFANEPAVAFCSGVLVDWDLVLTAGHCLRLLDLSSFSLVFGYYYREPGKLALSEDGTAHAVEILAEALDPEGSDPRLDFAWLRLAKPVNPRFEPAPIYTAAPELESADGVTTIGSPHGVPLKLDASGTVEDSRTQDDFFVAGTDTSAGWSGGAAYDAGFTLVGILARGGDDLVETPFGCRAVVRREPSAPSEEQFTYAHRALASLCANDPNRSICRPGCGRICQAAARPRSRLEPAGGCGMAHAGKNPDGSALALLLLALVRLGVNRGVNGGRLYFRAGPRHP
jgi:hypothetical protein